VRIEQGTIINNAPQKILLQFPFANLKASLRVRVLSSTVILAKYINIGDNRTAITNIATAPTEYNHVKDAILAIAEIIAAGIINDKANKTLAIIYKNTLLKNAKE